jgi:mannan endo-1,4-beta-mannosidase
VSITKCKAVLCFLNVLFFLFPAIVLAQLTGYIENFDDNILTDWALEAEHERTYTLTEADSMLEINYHRVTESWEWDNFNFTPPEIDASASPYLSIRAKSNIQTVLTIKPVYVGDDSDWLQVTLPGDNNWDTYYFTLLKAGTGNIVKIYLYLDGGSTALASGLVYLDDFHIGDQASVPPDFSDLTLALEDARALRDNSEEGTGEGQYAPDSKTELNNTISQAEALYAQPGVKQIDIDQMVAKLYDACVNFETKANVANIQINDSLATKYTKYLYSNLELLSGQYLMYGMHDATGYGVGWSGDDDRSDVKSVCGSYPAVYSWDMSVIDKNGDMNRFTYRIISAYQRGGINTICWHQRDPQNRGFYASDVGYENIVKTLLPGGFYHDFYKDKLRKISVLLKRLRGDDGHSIPIIFRPYHEHDGGWFWWGAGQCTKEEYRQIWQFTLEYLRDSLNVHNLIYAISPSQFTTQGGYFDIYPGHDYVDIFGTDHYFSSYVGDADRQKFLNKLHNVIYNALEYDKVAAVTEVGQEAIPMADWHTAVLLDPLKKDPIAQNMSYAAVWRNANISHHYAPYPGHITVPDFIDFYNDPYTLFEDDLFQIYKRDEDYDLPPSLYDLPQIDMTFYDTLVTVQLASNKRSYVNYSPNDESYESMPFTFKTGEGATRHETMVSGKHGQMNTYYVRAMDKQGLAMDTSAVFSFKVDTMIKPLYWNDLKYVTSEWKIGQAPLGYGNGTDSTEIDIVNTAYFRHEFSVADADSILFLSAFATLHDGAVIYLNGQRAGTINMSLSGDVNYDTKALDGSVTSGTTILDLTGLKSGKNVIAVEVHHGGTAANLSFDLKLFTSGADLIPRRDDWYYYDLGKMPEIQFLGTGITEQEETVPEQFVLYQNYPNPFNSETVIRYHLRTGSRVKIDVFNILGQKITTLIDKKQSAGIYSVHWDGRDDRNNLVASGLYLYRFETDYKVVSKKMMFVK